MGFDEGQITLNSDNGAYFPGQPIHARLVFNQDKVKKFRGIYAKLKGYCSVHWTTTHSRTNSQGKRETHTVNHDSYEEYVNHKVYLIGGEEGEIEIQPGRYEYPFEFVLPPNCPSSFEGSVGHIRYKVKVVVDRAFKIDQEKKVAIRVISPVDLNHNPYCREPMQFEFDDTYCCCCISRGATETVVKLPMSGYCPGQVIPVEVACENTGRVDIHDIKLIIKKVVSYRATTNPAVRETKDVIAEIKKGPVPGDTARNWNVEMVVPTIDTYNLSSCQYIDIQYRFKVVVSPGGCHSSSEDYKNLVIGNVPLVGYQDTVQNPLQDQMPQINAPIVNQPVSSYPGNSPYPGNTPYPTNPSYPGANPPFPGASPFPPPPGANPPYPNPQNTPYPTTPQHVANPPYPTTPQHVANPPYPATPQHVANPPYPNPQLGNTPYPPPPQNMANPPYSSPQNTPYPSSPSVPYPTTTPYPSSPNQTVQSPYQTKPPYPQNSTPYPPQDGPNPSYQGSGLKTGTFGFTVPSSMPIRSNSPNPMPPSSPLNPYATASAPPDTPEEGKQ